MKLFRASQSSVVHIEAVLTSNQSPVWPAKIFSEVYWYRGLQALFVTVYHTSVDLLCKKSYKSSSLLRYFNCFLSNHTVGCWNINFSCLSQIRKEKNSLCKQCLYIFVVLFAWLQLFRCHVWPTFHPETPLFLCFILKGIDSRRRKTTFWWKFMGRFHGRRGEGRKNRFYNFSKYGKNDRFERARGLVDSFFSLLSSNTSDLSCKKRKTIKLVQ